MHYAPEYFATVEIAKAVASVEDRYVTIEQNISNAVGWSGGDHFKGRAGNLPSKGRFDVAVWDENADIHGVIEVKLAPYLRKGSVVRDVRRLCDALRDAPKLRWGMSAFWLACWDGKEKKAGKSLSDRTENIIRAASKYAEERNLTCQSFVGKATARDDDGAVAGACVIVLERDQILG